MEYILLGIIGILVCVVIALYIKIALLKKSILEISSALSGWLLSDTNTVIDISSGDGTIRKLASEINRQLRELRKERQRFAQGDTELKNAVTNISHDLRTPLTAICGYLDLLEQEEKSENVKRYLSIIANRTDALKLLTEELFRYSVILSTQKEITCMPIVVNSVLEESIAEFYAILTEHKIQPNIQMPEQDVICSLDHFALSRIFSNLLSNVIKYSDGDLQITLGTDGTIRFSNSASELNKVAVEKLFDRFYTVEAARKSTGLGLSIARTLVEQMGGTIMAEYSNGQLFIQIAFQVIMCH